MASEPLHAANNNDYMPTGITDVSGNPYFRMADIGDGRQAPPPSGGGQPPGVHAVEIATLTQRINGALGWLGLLTLGFAGAFLFLINQIGSVSKNVSDTQSSVAAQSATLQDVKQGVDRITDKLDRKK